MEPKTDKQLVNEAFALLRRAHVTARQNFSCCGGCLAYELGNDAKVVEYAAYHKQDTARAFDPYGGLMSSLAIRYGIGKAHRASGTEEFEASAHAVARKIVAAFTEVGLAVEWDGSVNSVVEITHPVRMMKTVYVSSQEDMDKLDGYLSAAAGIKTLDVDTTWEKASDE